MSERKINLLMRRIREIEICSEYERESTDTLEIVRDTYTEYKDTLGF